MLARIASHSEVNVEERLRSYGRANLFVYNILRLTYVFSIICGINCRSKLVNSFRSIDLDLLIRKNRITYSSKFEKLMSKALLICAILFSTFVDAQTITWANHTWKVTSGGMAGVAPGNPANVTIDAKGYLHLHIVKHKGIWTASEVFTTNDFGFGTYQWV